jgi:hypothetical protein
VKIFGHVSIDQVRTYMRSHLCRPEVIFVHQVSLSHLNKKPLEICDVQLMEPSLLAAQAQATHFHETEAQPPTPGRPANARSSGRRPAHARKN